jgi:hypothetical protein
MNHLLESKNHWHVKLKGKSAEEAQNTKSKKAALCQS